MSQPSMMEVRGNIWIEEKNGLKLGKGRAMLLEKINETGSIAEAARIMGMSYRRAWAMVKAMNEASSLPLVEKSAGGKNGGGARLTQEGEKWVGCFQKLLEEFQQFARAHDM